VRFLLLRKTWGLSLGEREGANEEKLSCSFRGMVQAASNEILPDVLNGSQPVQSVLAGTYAGNVFVKARGTVRHLRKNVKGSSAGGGGDRKKYHDFYRSEGNDRLNRENRDQKNGEMSLGGGVWVDLFFRCWAEERV